MERIKGRCGRWDGEDGSRRLLSANRPRRCPRGAGGRESSHRDFPGLLLQGKEFSQFSHPQLELWGYKVAAEPRASHRPFAASQGGLKQNTNMGVSSLSWQEKSRSQPSWGGEEDARAWPALLRALLGGWTRLQALGLCPWLTPQPRCLRSLASLGFRPHYLNHRRRCPL